MNIVLWSAQCVMAVIFGYSGAFKSTHAKEKILASGQTGVKWYGIGFIRFIALCELIGCAGLVLPWLLGTARMLTPIAASGLAIIMVGAAGSHWRLARAGGERGTREWANVITNIVLLASCLLVAIGRAATL